MQPSVILRAWEDSLGRNSLFSGLKMASISSEKDSQEAIMDWSIEKRDTHLFHLRKRLFGSKFENLAICPNCSEQVEWAMEFSDLKVPDANKINQQGFDCEVDGYKIKFRLPSTRDLLTNDENTVIQNCIQSCEKNGDEIDFDSISGVVKKELVDRLESQSHLSNMVVRLDCKSCDHEWALNFDIVPYLWKEIDQWAKRFLNQVAVLASSFGWSEEEIINMNPNRRNYYLSLLNR